MRPVSSNPGVLIVGAGFGGICAAIKLRLAGYSNFLIVERAPGLGGVWHQNNYPGAACDVPICLYSFSFVEDFDWPRSHGTWAEIIDYLNFCIDRYDVREHIRFGVEAKAASWVDSKSRWRVTTSAGEIECKYVICACGLFNKPSIPPIEGLEKFSGRAFHSAQWEADFDATGKHVAVIGTGCSAAQFVPEIVDQASKLFVFQRSPCHVMPKLERAYSADERKLYASYPILRALERARLEEGGESFGEFQFNAEVRAARTAELIAFMRSRVRNEAKQQQLIPSYPLGGKRPIASDVYLQSLDRDNVELVTASIQKIVATGIVTSDGRHYGVDAILFGTGFNVSDYLVPLAVRGRKSQDLQDLWRNGAYAYLGMLVDGFPNFLMIYGPNSNIVGSILEVIETQVRFIVDQIIEAEASRRLIEVDPTVIAEFNADLQTALSSSIYGQHVARNYFSAASGKIVTQWPGTQERFRRAVAEASGTCFAPG
jgi:cation diffusion facilitator CzcD-associated flavoprotein CzcO